MKSVIIINMLLLIVSGILAQQNDTLKTNPVQFYKGDINISMFDGQIIIDEKGEPDFKMNMEFMNSGNRGSQVSVGFRGSKMEELDLNTRQKSQDEFEPAYRITGEGQSSKSLKIDLVPVINGLVPEKPL